MSFLDTLVKEEVKSVAKGQFNREAMEFILERGKVSRSELLILNLEIRLMNEFPDVEIDMDNPTEEMLEFVKGKMNTAKVQTDAFITNTTNHRSFNGWAAKNKIMLFMEWNAGKTEIKLVETDIAGKQPSELTMEAALTQDEEPTLEEA